MRQYSRAFTALFILLCGLALLPQITLLAGTVNWQRFAGAYEDIVVVTRAEWRGNDNTLRLRATTSAGPNAVLTAFETSTGQQIGVLGFQAGLEHRGEFAWPHNPVVVTVRSSQGGQATVLVTGDSPPTTTSVATTPTSGTPTATAVAATSTSVATTATTPVGTATTAPTTPATPTAIATTATPTGAATAATGTPPSTSVPMRRQVFLPRLLKE